jgi:hypothetical protein
MSFNDVFRSVRFRADDPLRYLHVPRRERVDSDEAHGSAVAAVVPADDDLEREDEPYGQVVPEHELA